MKETRKRANSQGEASTRSVIRMKISVHFDDRRIRFLVLLANTCPEAQVHLTIAFCSQCSLYNTSFESLCC